MRAEIVMIGTELLLGQIVDTNAAYMAGLLAENGVNLYQKTTVGDNAERIKRVLNEALGRADVVLTSGGLGPTEDDITRECVAELLGRALTFRQELLDQIAARFAKFRRPMTENNRRQAYVPEGAIPIENPNGTAPGLIVEGSRGVIICMPGVPGELKPMLRDSVIPYLRGKFGLAGVIHSRVLKVCGVGESRIDAAIGDLIRTSPNPTIGLLASPEAVQIRISAHAQSLDEANAMIDPVDAEVRTRLPGLVMGVDSDTVQSVVARLICTRGWRLAIGDRCTGGMVAQLLSSAACFTGALVLPASEGAAGSSETVAKELAEAARSQFRSECALGLAADGKGGAAGAFVTPEGSVAWHLAYLSASEMGRLRLAVSLFEHVRRHLSWSPAELQQFRE